MSQEAERIREVIKRKPQEKLTALLHPAVYPQLVSSLMWR